MLPQDCRPRHGICTACMPLACKDTCIAEAQLWACTAHMVQHRPLQVEGNTVIVFRDSVRKEADAKRLQAELGDFFTPLIFDVTDEAAVRKAAAEVKSRMKGRTLLGLVNNAGEEGFLVPR